MAETGIKELLESGVHFGHQTRRWDPSMRRYIHGERDGIHIIDLLQTEQLLNQARDFCAEIAGRGGKILFVGTKKQARDTIEEWAEKTGMPYVSRRWLGGLLTNFQTINKRIKRLHELTELETNGQLALLPTKERMAREAELRKLEFNLGGVRDMERPPEAIFVIDLNAEEIAVNEARRLDLPIVALVDTNCNPRPVEFVIPGNDDAIRSCGLIVSTLGEAILTSRTAWQAAEDARHKREEEERKKREEEQRIKREAEEAKKLAQAERLAQAKAAAEAESAVKGPSGAAKAPAQATPKAAAPATARTPAPPKQSPSGPPQPAKAKPAAAPKAAETTEPPETPAKPDEPPAEEAKSAAAPAEETKPAEAPAEDAKPDDSPAEEAKPDDDEPAPAAAAAAAEGASK